MDDVSSPLKADYFVTKVPCFDVDTNGDVSLNRIRNCLLCTRSSKHYSGDPISDSGILDLNQGLTLKSGHMQNGSGKV